MRIFRLQLILLSILLSGCSLFGTSSSDRDQKGFLLNNPQSSKYTRNFKVDFETMWSVVIVSLDGLPLKEIDKENGIVKTGWVEGFSQKKARGIITDRFKGDYEKERRFITVNIQSNGLVSTVTVKCRVQEKARGGSAAYRWERVASTGEREEEILAKIEKMLNERVRGYRE